MIKVKSSLVVMAASRGRISERQGEDISCNPTLVCTDSAAYSDKACCAQHFPTLVIRSKFADCCLGVLALACSGSYALGMGKGVKRNLFGLQLPMSSAT